MKINHTILSSAAVVGLTLVTGSAFGQEASASVAVKAPKVEAPKAPEVEAPKAEASASAEAPAAEVDAAAAAEAPEVEAPEVEAPAAPEPEVEAEAPEMEAPAAPEPEVEVEAEAEEEEATGSPSLFVFADAWAGIQTTKSGAGTGGGVYANNGPGGTTESGFGINWLGADIGYDGGDWAVNGSLRFGDAVATYGTGTLGPITNAYATWRPVEGLSLDMGAFGTIYGAEVAESWQNLNYTRGELYFNMQPFWHTGLRAEYASGDFVVRGLLVNDANTSNLGEGALNGGLQFGYDTGSFGIVAGALQSFAPKTTVNAGGFVDTFFDVVVTASAGDFSLIGNFDLNVGYEATDFWGASLAAGYAFTPVFGAAIRGEYLSSANDFMGFGAEDGEENLITGTLTLDTKPTGSENFVVRWDNRIEAASEEVYAESPNGNTKKTWFSSTIGVVAYADLL